MSQDDNGDPKGPRKVGKLTVSVDRDLCIGAASCVAVAPKTFVMDDEAKAIFLPTAKDDSEQTVIDAAKACPVAAVIIKDEEGKQVFP